MTVAFYIAAAIAEIAGCFSFWLWLRMEKSPWWIVPGTASLMVFAYLLTYVDTSHAGRAYAAYGGVYILASQGWMWAVEGVRPVMTDWVGVTLCILGAVVIITGAKAGGLR